MTNPLISICMITYGHEKYIREAIESILMQKTNFTIELVLANDCSPDNTDQIVKDILTNHPNSGVIKYIKQPKNIGMMPNFIDAIKNCNGEYFAFCEGDDYWTDPYKLQKQVDFLEANKEVSLSGHNSNILRKDNSTVLFNKLNTTKYYTIEDVILKQWFIPTCSIVLRKNAVFPLPTWLAQVKHGDLSILLLAASKGKIYYDPTPMAVYRKHDGGVSNNVNNSVKTIVETYDLFNKHSKYKYKGIINYRNYRLLLNEAKTEHYITLRLKKIQSAIKYKVPKKPTEIIELLKVIIKQPK